MAVLDVPDKSNQTRMNTWNEHNEEGIVTLGRSDEDQGSITVLRFWLTCAYR